MRDLFSKIMTGSMVAGAALLVAACGGSETAETNTTNMTEMESTDPMMDGTTNDVTATDAATMDANMMGGNMTMDSNMSMDANMTGGNMGGMEGNMTNGM
jgi:hypothetical protein